eukprot:15100-Pleurochrysis_carterae.AAC.1
MTYKWGYPVATLHNTSLSHIDVHSANHHPFPGHEPSTMPGFDPNHLAHQQSHVVKELLGFSLNHQIKAPEVQNYR